VIKPRRALVIGGSMGGLFAANLLLRAGWDVEVFERVGAELAERGAGIVTHGELFRALQRIGIAIDDTIGIEAQTRTVLDREGQLVAEIQFPQILTAWGRLYRLLKDALPAARYHFNKSFERAEERSGSITAYFSDGVQVTGDLVIGADGIRSAVRAQLVSQAKPAYAGYVAWRGMVDETQLSDAARRGLFGSMAFCMPAGEMMLGYLVAGLRNTTATGERRYNFVWYRPVDAATELPALLTDAQGRRHDMNIPPDRVRAEAVADMRAAAARMLAPQFVEVVEKTAQPFFQPIYDLESPRVVAGRVALIGDAAFVARPHLGLGVSKAAADAVALADAVAGNPGELDAALQKFNGARVSYGRKVVAEARRLGSGIGPEVPRDRDPALVARYRNPEVIISEVAPPIA
jgi:2-polyprenyl-6-methoxyphenol hydroxylase-like FAD-dependent oxidoreductase